MAHVWTCSVDNSLLLLLTNWYCHHCYYLPTILWE